MAEKKQRKARVKLTAKQTLELIKKCREYLDQGYKVPLITASFEEADIRDVHGNVIPYQMVLSLCKKARKLKQPKEPELDLTPKNKFRMSLTDKIQEVLSLNIDPTIKDAVIRALVTHSHP